MNRSITWRLMMLESNIQEKIPTFGEFQTQWAQMDELSRSIYAEICGNPANFRDEPKRWRKYLEQVRKYLKKMRVIGEDAKSLLDIARELEGSDCNSRPND